MLSLEIKQYLINKGVSQAFVSRETGLTSDVVSAVLNGTRKLMVDEYFAICECLEVPITKFYVRGSKD